MSRWRLAVCTLVIIGVFVGIAVYVGCCLASQHIRGGRQGVQGGAVSQAEEENRLRRLVVSWPLLKSMLTTGIRNADVIERPLPTDTTLEFTRLDPRGDIVLILASMEWEPAPNRSEWPEIESPLFRAIY